MGTFAAATSRTEGTEDHHKPPKVILVQPEAFAFDWPGRPSEAVEMGLRIIPDDDLSTARAEAARYAARMHSDDDPNQFDCFNDALLRHRIARTTCSPLDEREPWFRAAEDMVRVAISAEGVKSISFEIDLFETETSPLSKPANDEEIADLVALLLKDDPFDGMDEARERRLRRLLGVVLEDIGAARAELGEQDEATIDMDD